MKIDQNKCVGCGNCVPVCSMGVISVERGRVTVNENECVECNTCYRTLRNERRNPLLVRAIRWGLGHVSLAYDPEPDVCPTGALMPLQLAWPRSLRAVFSDPTIKHPSTGVGGRGTEEIKSNDVTGRLRAGDIGLVVELGRPGLGTRFRDLQSVAQALAEAGVRFEARNPVTHLMSDPATGTLREDVLDEKVMSAIIECRTDLEHLPSVLATLQEAARHIDTVISAGVSARCGSRGEVPYVAAVEGCGFALSLNSKTNLGLGRPLFAETSPVAETPA
ncbi:MAG: 4Fe-4S binding protein [Chloroflexi bacterium]|nr:4Fe-4S binding protein [Chloroflexota bacterium]